MNQQNLAISDSKLADFCQRWGILELDLFGSVLRDDFRPDSDVDVLVTFREGTRRSLMELVEMEQQLSDLVGRKVDLVERESVERSENYLRRRHILQSLQPIYVAG
jgi:uncharacterized protein